MRLSVAATVWVSAILPLNVAAQERVPCSYSKDVEQTCGAFACVPTPETRAEVSFEDEPPPAGTPGFCGKCEMDADCGGGKCDAGGTCADWDEPIAANPLRATFHLVTADLALDVLDADNPVVSIGYMYQFSLTKTKPVALDDGGWLTLNVPLWYLSLEGAVAFGGVGQNVFGRVGIARYFHTAVTSFALGAMYQRQGTEIWELGDNTNNFNRLGPYATVEFLYNLRVGAAFLGNLDANHPANDDHAVVLFVSYQRDLLEDLIPDRFLKLIPERFR